MPEFRQNIATREWVIIATERAKRPEQFVKAPHESVFDRPAHDPKCPFCPGNEELDLERLRLPEHEHWQVRVVANRFPALQEQTDHTPQYEAVGHALSGIGYHEVVVESRQHNTCPALETVEEIELTLRANQMRGAAIMLDSRIVQLIYFKNHGISAGASLVHPHTQILALPIVPHSIEDRLTTARRYYEQNQHCVFCHILAEEESAGRRIIMQTEYFSSFIPYAAASPFHCWIVPRQHNPCFLDASAAELHDLAKVLHDMLRRLFFGLGDPDYNYIIRTAPRLEQQAPHLHWYVSIVPRVVRQAGFEIGSGMYINTALPEESARFLRDVGVDNQ